MIFLITKSERGIFKNFEIVFENSYKLKFSPYGNCMAATSIPKYCTITRKNLWNHLFLYFLGTQDKCVTEIFSLNRIIV